MCKPTLKVRVLLALLGTVCLSGAQGKTCNVDAGLAFGAYDTATSAPLDIVGSIMLTCSSQVQANVSLSVGSGYGASYSGGRKMTPLNGVGTMTYNLYADAALTQVWGDGTGGSRTVNLNGKSKASQPVWGRIAGGQRALKAGSYADRVEVTVAY